MLGASNPRTIAIHKFAAQSKRLMRKLVQTLTGTTIAPESNNEIMLQARQIMQSGSAIDAAKFIEARCAPEHRPVANLFRANAAGHDDRAWGRSVNAYLAQFNLLPLAIAAGPGHRFHRLTCQPTYGRTDGPHVSVIMPAFNAEATLALAARSILNQTWRNLELFIVDDASTDRTPHIAQQLATEDGRVKVLHNSVNVGPYVSKNRALADANGSYFTGHDADDWAHPQRLERQLAAMTTDRAVKASIASMVRMTATGEFREFKSIGRTSFDGAARLASISCLFEMDVFRNRIGHWDQVRFGADSELIERAKRILGNGFRSERLIAMLCLDSPGSLTNNPEHGVDAGGRVGLSPTRVDYRRRWTAWHQSMDIDTSRLEFPQSARRFTAPDVMLVSSTDVERILLVSEPPTSKTA
jgi:Glycosyl transferase family 2